MGNSFDLSYLSYLIILKRRVCSGVFGKGLPRSGWEGCESPHVPRRCQEHVADLVEEAFWAIWERLWSRTSRQKAKKRDGPVSDSSRLVTSDEMALIASKRWADRLVEGVSNVGWQAHTT